MNQKLEINHAKERCPNRPIVLMTKEKREESLYKTICIYPFAIPKRFYKIAIPRREDSTSPVAIPSSTALFCRLDLGCWPPGGGGSWRYHAKRGEERTSAIPRKMAENVLEGKRGIFSKVGGKRGWHLVAKYSRRREKRKHKQTTL